MESRDFLRTGICALAALAVLALATPAAAQTATALLREDDPLPGAAGETVSSLSNPAVNHVGGFALTVNTSGSGTTLSHIWGHATGGPGNVIVTEGTYGNLQQTSFESFHGFSNAGMPCYSATSTDTVSGTTGLDGVWVGTTVVLNEEDPVPTLPGQFSTFNSRPAITAEGMPTWVGGYSTNQGGSTQNRALFYGFGILPLLKGGDFVGGIGEPIESGSSNIDFDYRFSASGTNYITPVLVDTGSSTDDGVIVSNGAAVMRGGGVLREAMPVPLAVGGLAGENWDNFDFMGITESGMILVTGDTDAATTMDEFVLVGDTIMMREGDIIAAGVDLYTVSGSIEGGYLNEDGDWAVIWDITDIGGTNVEALLFDGELLLKEGDAVDLDGDGVIEPASILANFTGITTLVMGDRQPNGILSIYFTADIDTQGTSSSSDDTEGLFRIDLEVGIPGDDEDPDDEGMDDMMNDGPAGIVNWDDDVPEAPVIPKFGPQPEREQSGIRANLGRTSRTGRTPSLAPQSTTTERIGPVARAVLVHAIKTAEDVEQALTAAETLERANDYAALRLVRSDLRRLRDTGEENGVEDWVVRAERLLSH